jgi:anti-anti-sigma factor
MDIRRADDGMPVLKLAGRLDFTLRERFVAMVEAISDDLTDVDLRVDCSQLDDIDSSGLGLLLILRDRFGRSGRSVILLNCGQRVRDVLGMVQFGRLFTLG